MRKIFIDCGANDGCSLRMFSTVFKDYQDFSAYSFECSDEFYAELVSTGNEIGFKEFFPFKKAVWISEGKKRYHVQSHSLEDTSNLDDGSGVESIDISKFISKNFSKDDYIIFKIDIEGAEYKVIDKMFHDGTLSYINEFYGELHGPKKGYTIDDNNRLLEQLNQFGLLMYNWDALNGATFDKIEIVPFGTTNSHTTHSSKRVGHAYRKIMEKITFCIPSKNNLRYLKSCIPSIRNNAYRKDHDIIVFVDKDTDGTIDWLKENSESLNVKYVINPDLNNSLYGIGRAYDKCIAESETDIVMVFHADMYLCKNTDLIMYEKLTENSVVCATRIEPPLHPPGPEKIVEDFGLWPEIDIQDGFKEDQLNKYVERLTIENHGKTTNGCFAPWMVHKKNIVSIGGHDPILKSAREDSDIFNRFVLSGLDLIQVWNGFVYHLTCRGGQFEHGILTNDHSQKSMDWQILMDQSTWDYARKWGSFVEHDKYLMPIVHPKFDIGLVLTNSNYQLAKFIEPWVSTLYLDNESVVSQLTNELKFTSGYSDSRVLFQNQLKDHDVIVEVNSNDLVTENAKWIPKLNQIISQANEKGIFEFQEIQITIHRLVNKNKELIPINNEFFK